MGRKSERQRGKKKDIGREVKKRRKREREKERRKSEKRPKYDGAFLTNGLWVSTTNWRGVGQALIKTLIG